MDKSNLEKNPENPKTIEKIFQTIAEWLTEGTENTESIIPCLLCFP